MPARIDDDYNAGRNRGPVSRGPTRSPAASRTNQAIWNAARSAVSSGYRGTVASAVPHINRDLGRTRSSGVPAKRSTPTSSSAKKSSSSSSSSRSRGYSSGGGGGYGRGGGGGGGGGRSGPSAADIAKANAQKQLDFLKQLLGSEYYKPKPDDALRGRVNTAVDADLAFANKAYDELGVQQAAVGPNPYASFRPQVGQSGDTRIAALMAQQGASTTPWDAEMAQSQSAGAAQGANWANLASILQQALEGSRQSATREGGQARAYVQNELGAQRSQLLGQVDMRDKAVKEQRQQAAMEVIAQVAGLIGQHGLKAPTLAELGLA